MEGRHPANQAKLKVLCQRLPVVVSATTSQGETYSRLDIPEAQRPAMPEALADAEETQI